jgi:hypothetical protein
MLQADNVRAMLPTTVEKFKAISFAGWFRTNASACKDATRCPWPGAMQHAFTMQNMRGSDDDKEKACLRKHGWRCMHSGLAARRVKAPLFVVQSALDSWSLANIWRGSDPEQTREVSKRSCIGSCFESCSVEETDDLNGFATALVSDVSDNVLFRAGNGAFVTNCCTHELHQLPRYELDSTLEKGVTMIEAIRRWWEAPAEAPASAHAYLPSCSLSTDSPGGCNPSCKTRQSACSGRAFDAIGASLTASCDSDATCLPNLDLDVRQQGIAGEG